MGQPLGFLRMGWKMLWYSRWFRSLTESSKVRTTWGEGVRGVRGGEVGEDGEEGGVRRWGQVR